MNALVTETIGTFFLVLAIGLSVGSGSVIAPLSIGFTLMVMVYAGGRLSGAHYNPAVSVAAVIRGALPAAKLVPYWAAQFLGAIAASFLVYKFYGHPLHVAPAEQASILKVLVGEAVCTFGLAYVVLHVATGKGTEGNNYFGLAIGATVAAFAVAMGPITGGAFNPAVGLGPAAIEAIVGGGFPPRSWVYAVGPIAGAVAAAYVFKFQEA